MRLQALNDFVIVKPLEQPMKNINGIYIPPTAQLKNIEGIVISVSISKKTEDISVGDHIIYDYKAGNPVDIDGEKYLFLPIEALLAKKY